ncbi:MAG: ATP-binding protein [Oscillospiraceae bacterium]|nr:ATP-binding protein [Oscillospiraceae bacterium]
MQYASKIEDIFNAFRPKPLSIEELDEFYYGDTMKVRTGNPVASPIRFISESCKTPSDSNIFLLLGHRGCGKSTELNHMSKHLLEDGYQVRTVDCAADLDLRSPVYEDLLILMGDALLSIADDCGCELDGDLRDLLEHYWDDVEQERTTDRTGSLEAAGALEVKTPVLGRILKISTTLKGRLKYNEERRTIYRQRISQRLSEWTQAMNQIADDIAAKLEGKQPIVIFEDLDKLEPKEAWGVFYDHARTLSDFSFPVIYTFPIALSYDPRFHALESFFQTRTFPMIKVQKLEGGRNKAGFDVIRNLLGMRADLDALFEGGVLDRMIEKTGGSLRNLFDVIKDAAMLTQWREATRIGAEDADYALVTLQSKLTRMIEKKHYAFLAEIALGNREQIEDKEMLLEMLQGGIVLEYNGKHWYNVHPLVEDFLRVQGLMNRKPVEHD